MLHTYTKKEWPNGQIKHNNYERSLAYDGAKPQPSDITFKVRQKLNSLAGSEAVIEEVILETQSLTSIGHLPPKGFFALNSPTYSFGLMQFGPAL